MQNPILKDLEELIEAGIITGETATRIESYYNKKQLGTTNRFTVVLSILGALLVSLGIILLVAHNWDDLSPLIKTILAFLPLAIGQGFCYYTIRKRSHDLAWKESSGIILFFGVGACLALISQIYHISGDLSDLLLTWTLLGLPLIYILPSYVTGLLAIGIATWYAVSTNYFTTGTSLPYWYFVILILILPSYINLSRNPLKSNFYHTYNWLLAISLFCSLGAFVKNGDNILWVFVTHLVLSCLFYLIGTNRSFSRYRLLANPFYIIGVVGILFILLLWSYEPVWEMAREELGLKFPLNSFFSYLSGLLIIITAIIFGRNQQQEGLNKIDPMGLSFIVFILALLFFATSPRGGVLMLNIWLLVLALYFIRKGSSRNSLPILNLGLLIISALAILRFFDDSIPFVWRGLIFLIAGVGFFAGNFMLIKRRKAMLVQKK